MIELQDKEIKSIEESILKHDDSENWSMCNCLLSIRKNILNKRALDWKDEILPDIIAFNDVLTAALREMYDRAHSIWETIKTIKEDPNLIHFTAECNLGEDYPAMHPLQSDNRQKLWTILRNKTSNSFWGILSLEHMIIPKEKYTFEHFVGMDFQPPPPLDSNDGFARELNLIREMTKDLHLTSALYSLFFFSTVAITDVIYVRQFETRINIGINKTMKLYEEEQKDKEGSNKSVQY